VVTASEIETLARRKTPIPAVNAHDNP
jgi:hypothetical protein